MLVTKRLVIRAFSGDDQEAVIRLFTDDTVKKTYMLPDFTVKEQAIRLFERMRELSFLKDRYVRGVYLDNTFIGVVNDTGIEGKKIEVGYAFLPAYYNQGYATEMLQAVIDDLFSKGFEEILAGAFEKNIASQRVMQKAGMKRIDMTEDVEYRGEVHHCVYYAAKRENLSYQDINARTIDSWNQDEGWEWGRPISHEVYEKAKQGEWGVYLTPTKTMPRSWFPENLKGVKILGLASGGGQQMPVFAALGMECTVLDYSPSQLASEKLVAEREGYDIEIIRYDMTKPLPFGDESFDIIFQPVSTCYIEEVKPLFKECARILKKGGLFITGCDNGVNFLTYDEKTIEVVMPFNPLKNEEQRKFLEESNSGYQFSHSLEENIGGQLEAGLVITHIYEDIDNWGRLAELNIPAYYATRAVKSI